MNHRPKRKPNSLKILEDSIGENLCDLGYTKSKIDKGTN